MIPGLLYTINSFIFCAEHHIMWTIVSLYISINTYEYSMVSNTLTLI